MKTEKTLLTELYFIMNIKNRIIIIVLSLYSLFATIFFIASVKGEKDLNTQINDLNERYEIITDHITTNFSLNFTTNFSNIINEKNILIYRFSDDMCENCIYEDLTLLRQIQKEFGFEKILLLPAYAENRNSQIRLSNELKGFQYKNISDTISAFPINKQIGIKNRYMAYINNNGEIEMFFMPIKGESELTKKYLLKIKETFFSE